jgi:hypothetical protein
MTAGPAYSHKLQRRRGGAHSESGLFAEFGGASFQKRLHSDGVHDRALGVVNPPVADGVITGSALSHQMTVTATVNGHPADVLYAGTAPGLVAGVNQVNVRIPTASTSGNARIAILVGTGPSPARSSGNVTVAVE